MAKRKTAPKRKTASAANLDRYTAMVLLTRAGWGKAQIGRAFGVSRERVFEILAQGDRRLKELSPGK